MNKTNLVWLLMLASLPLVAQDNKSNYYTGYEGVVLGEKAPRSATDAVTQQVLQQDVPGDIYRGTVFGSKQAEYKGKQLGNRPRATTKYVYDTSLIRAIKISDVDRVKTLMYANVNVNEKNYAGITPLTVAAERGNMEIVKMLVEEKANVNEKSSYGITPLLAATAAGNAEVVEYLIANGADIKVEDDLGKNPLTYASGFENPKLLTALINQDTRAVDTVDKSGNTPILYAAKGGCVGNVKVLLANGADVNYKNPTTGVSALATAAAENNVNLIKLLVKNGHADINLPDLMGRTPIFYAIEQNSKEATKLLLSLGADVNAQDKNGTTPLMRATAKDSQDILDMLLKQKNIVVDAKDIKGQTALFYTIFNEDVASAETLVTAKAYIDETDLEGNTPLLNAIKAKHDRLSIFFIQQGTDLTIANKAKQNAFTLANLYLPNSSTYKVLSVKQQAAYQDALQVQAQKLADVRSLEQELAEQEAEVAQLKAQELAEQKAKAAQELADKQFKEQALREELQTQYQKDLEEDPEILELQQRLNEAKARKQAALQQKIDQQISSVNDKVEQVTTKVENKVVNPAKQVKKTAVRKTTTTIKNTKTAAKRAVAIPQEVNMAELL